MSQLIKIILFIVTISVVSLNAIENEHATFSKNSEAIINLPYGVTLHKKRVEDESFMTEYTYVFTQNGKEVDRISDYRIFDIYDGDMDKDGVEELLFSTFSGGAHCCFEYVIIQIEEKMQKATRISLSSAESIEFKDLDGDGKKEWILWDDQYSYFADFSFAGSPGLKIAASYSKGALSLRPDLMKKYILNKKEQLSRFIVSYRTYEDKNYLTMEKESGRIGLEMFLYYFYLGEYQKGTEVLQKHAYFDGEISKKLFFKEFVERASQSYFWNQLKEINFGKNILSNEEVQALLENSLIGKG